MTEVDFPLAPLEYLVGNWNVTNRTGSPGVATGGEESWLSEVGGTLLTRRSWCEFPQTPQRPAFRHEDLLVIYVDSESRLQGVFWDNEGHVHFYRHVQVAVGGDGVRLVTDAAIPGPRQALEYQFLPPNRTSAVFSLLVPGAPDFKPYLQWECARSKSGPA
ncbi:MAG: hypothetical protein ABSA63_07760 [Thermoplasmata archaeon]